MRAASQRMKRLRRRRACGLISLTIDAPDTLALTLCEVGFLKPDQVEDRTALRRAIERFLAAAHVVTLHEK